MEFKKIEIELNEEGRISSNQLDFLISMLKTSHRRDKWDTYQKLTDLLNKEFDLEITVEDVIGYFSKEIEDQIFYEEEDRRQQYINLGYYENRR